MVKNQIFAMTANELKNETLPICLKFSFYTNFVVQRHFSHQLLNINSISIKIGFQFASQEIFFEFTGSRFKSGSRSGLAVYIIRLLGVF